MTVPLNRALAVCGWGALGVSVHAWINARLLRTPPSSPPSCTELVSVLVPARNEAARIAPTVRSVLAQKGVELELLVLDDGSTDRTAEVVAEAGAGDARLRVLQGRELALGWMGKPHACQQLAEAASGSVLVFVDADVSLEPHAIAAAVHLMRAGSLGLVSPYPRQVAVTPAERLMQPLLQWLLLSFLPFRMAERLRPVSMAAANGQFLVVSASAYRGSGGHGAVRDRVVEDVWLARAFKAAGHRAAVVDGTSLASCRMYTGFSEVRDGYSKSLWAAFGSPAGAAAMAAVLGALYIAPPVAAIVGLPSGRQRLTTVGLLGYLAGVGGRTISAHRTGGRVADSFAHPLSIATLLWLVARSWLLHRRGTLEWRGRSIGVSRG